MACLGESFPRSVRGAAEKFSTGCLHVGNGRVSSIVLHAAHLLFPGISEISVYTTGQTSALMEFSQVPNVFLPSSRTSGERGSYLPKRDFLDRMQQFTDEPVKADIGPLALN